MEKYTAHYRLIAPARDEIVDLDILWGPAEEWPERAESRSRDWSRIPLGAYILGLKLVLHNVVVHTDGLERDRDRISGL